ncbi:MAG TPA: polyprenyl synthetase family protein [Thermoanaerobaculia bacterium]|jgi:geranylgeranyl diphosphate synthase type I|nr:polyprenyl synthetase family protein [Thermoanaerobaculia bacterium]
MTPTFATALAPGAAPPVGEALPFAPLLAEFRDRLDAQLQSLLAAKRQAAAPGGETGSTEADPARLELIDGVGRLANLGGKRLRPAFVWFTYRALGGRRSEEALPLALATELLHTYLLIHDDVMDHADLRRGEPSAQVRFRDAHRARNLAGNAGEFGVSVAILLGDLAQTWAIEQVFGLAVEGARRGELLQAFSAMCEEVIAGQYSELLIAGRRGRPGEVREEELLRVLQMKSGRYTAERPIELGAILAGAPPAEKAALRRYGRAVGEAFQLQDDLLGTFGDPERTGKPVEADLKEGKLTFLIHHALAASAAPERAMITAALGDPQLDEERAREIQRLIEASGARAKVEAMIDLRLAEARDALSGLALEPEGEVFFSGLLDHLRGRET